MELKLNLKLDVMTDLNTDKRYAEIELARLSSDFSVPHKEKIKLINDQLKEIAILNAQMGLAEQYFIDAAPQQQEQQQVQQQKGQMIHQGQTHGE